MTLTAPQLNIISTSTHVTAVASGLNVWMLQFPQSAPPLSRASQHTWIPLVKQNKTLNLLDLVKQLGVDCCCTHQPWKARGKRWSGAEPRGVCRRNCFLVSLKVLREEIHLYCHMRCYI